MPCQDGNPIPAYICTAGNPDPNFNPAFNTLAGKDAWHSASGYRSKQSMKAITLHKTHGEVTRNTVTLAMGREVQDAK